jgi:hypothetical protein
MKTIQINAIQFAEILGHESSSLMLSTEDLYFPGDEVVLKVYSVNDNMPTGAELKRFITDVELIGYLKDEPYLFELRLSALRPSFLCQA